MSYVIVKYAAPERWRDRWLLDPSKVGVLESDSAAFTAVGVAARIKSKYDNYSEALHDAIRINRLDPTGAYNVCPQIKVGRNAKRL